MYILNGFKTKIKLNLKLIQFLMAEKAGILDMLNASP
jgi:hypothetical protein